MDLIDYVEGGSLTAVVGGIAYSVNKWLIPAYKGLRSEIEELREKLDLEIKARIEVEKDLSYLRGKYAEKTVLKSGRFKEKRNED